jgi:hypothetical protein
VSAEFCHRLAAEGRSIYFSTILRLEWSEAIRKLATKPGRTPPDVYQHYQLDQWERSLFVRRRWFEFGIRQFGLLLDSALRQPTSASAKLPISKSG